MYLDFANRARVAGFPQPIFNVFGITTLCMPLRFLRFRRGDFLLRKRRRLEGHWLECWLQCWICVWVELFAERRVAWRVHIWWRRVLRHQLLRMRVVRLRLQRRLIIGSHDSCFLWKTRKSSFWPKFILKCRASVVLLPVKKAFFWTGSLDSLFLLSLVKYTPFQQRSSDMSRLSTLMRFDLLQNFWWL